MPVVPYNPVPQQALSSQGLADIRPNVPAEAFGGDIATAISGFGKSVSGAGDAIFERALWLQNLNNEAEARKTTADYTVAVGKLTADYNAKEGSDAVKAYPEYAKAIRVLRDQYGGTLSTPMSQRIYDSQSQGVMAHGIMNSATHAVGQQKAFTIKSFDAANTADLERLSLDPENKTLADQIDYAMEARARKLGDLHGAPPQDTENNIRVAKSSALVTRIQALMQDNPPAARQMFKDNEEAIDHTLRGKVDNATETLLTQHYATKGATDYIASHTDDEGNLTVPIKTMDADLRKLATNLAPDNDKLPEALVNQAHGLNNKNQYAHKDEVRRANETIYDSMLNGATSLPALMKDGSGAAAWQILPPSEQAKWSKRFDQYNVAEGKKYNEEVMKQMQGMKENSNTVTDFLEIDPTSKDLNLSRSNIDTVLRWQKEAKKDIGKSGKVNSYLNLLEGNYAVQLGELKLMDRGKANAAQYDQFSGSVIAAVDAWKEQKGSKTYPTDQQFLKEIAPQLMQQTIRKTGMFDTMWQSLGMPNKTYGFQAADTSSDQYKAYVKEKTQEYLKRGLDPDQYEIDRQYKAQVFKEIMELNKGPKK